MNTQKLVTLFNKSKNTVAKYSPEILLATGIISGAAGLVVCIKKTLTISEKMEDSYVEIMEVDRKDKKAVVKAYGKAAGVIAREYAPVAILEGASVACIIGSNKILNERNLSLLAAVTLIEKDFNRYRNNVKKRFGEEVDNELYFGIETEKVTEVEVDPETGKKKKVKKEVTRATSWSPYAVFFDATSDRYDETLGEDWNIKMVHRVESAINEKAFMKGKVFLSDIYEGLDIKDEYLTVEQRRAARSCGYIWNYDDCSDSQIKFFVSDTWNKEAVEAAENGEIRDNVSLLVDFSGITCIVDDYAAGCGTFC